MQGQKVSVIERYRRIRCANQNRRSWLWKFAQLGEIHATGEEPGIINRMHGAERLDHIGSLELIMLRRHDDIEMARRNARIKNLHGEALVAAPRAKAAREQSGATAASYGYSGPRRCDGLVMAIAHATSSAKLEPRRKPIPRRIELQIDFARIQFECSRECECLTSIARGSIVNHPAACIGGVRRQSVCLRYHARMSGAV